MVSVPTAALTSTWTSNACCQCLSQQFVWGVLWILWILGRGWSGHPSLPRGTLRKTGSGSEVNKHKVHSPAAEACYTPIRASPTAAVTLQGFLKAAVSAWLGCCYDDKMEGGSHGGRLGKTGTAESIPVKHEPGGGLELKQRSQTWQLQQSGALRFSPGSHEDSAVEKIQFSRLICILSVTVKTYAHQRLFRAEGFRQIWGLQQQTSKRLIETSK